MRGAAVHDIETKLKEGDNPRLTSGMLMMRRHEKDFMLRRDRKYGDDMKKRAAEFTAGLDSANLADAAKAELKQKLADYQRDFAAWMEVYLGGRWHTFDARHNARRIGRILMARGRDATDVAMVTSFGPCKLRDFKVFTDEVSDGIASPRLFGTDGLHQQSQSAF